MTLLTIEDIDSMLAVASADELYEVCDVLLDLRNGERGLP